MKRWIAAIALATGLFNPASAEPIAVVELFTSEGCSSCPPADATLARLARDEDFIALAFHVDYWDYLGWADTVSIAEASARQRAYAAARGDNALYTPQAIVNGRLHVVGRDEAGIRRAAEAAAGAEEGLTVPVTFHADEAVIRVHVGGGNAEGSPATVWLVTYARRMDVAISGGENAGRRMAYAHVVRSLHPIGVWSGRPFSAALPAEGTLPEDADGLAVLVQRMDGHRPGAILGAAAGPVR